MSRITHSLSLTHYRSSTTVAPAPAARRQVWIGRQGGQERKEGGKKRETERSVHCFLLFGVLFHSLSLYIYVCVCVCGGAGTAAWCWLKVLIVREFVGSARLFDPARCERWLVGGLWIQEQANCHDKCLQVHRCHVAGFMCAKAKNVSRLHRYRSD